MMGKVYMEWSKPKAVHILSLFGWKKEHLKKLSEKELFDKGITEGAWHGENPFIEEKQVTLGEFK